GGRRAAGLPLAVPRGEPAGRPRPARRRPASHGPALGADLQRHGPPPADALPRAAAPSIPMADPTAADQVVRPAGRPSGRAAPPARDLPDTELQRRPPRCLA